MKTKPIYLARAMSGRNKAEVVAEASKDRVACYTQGFTPLDPVAAEGVKAENCALQSTKKQMDIYWYRDKAMIREAIAFVDCTPHLKSQGVEREGGYARYFCWIPVVRVFPKGQLPPEGSVAYYEDDIIVDDLAKALELITTKWGTQPKRFKWRLKMLNRSLFKFIFQQLKELFR